MINDMKYTYEFLRKCHGLRFKAVRSGENIEGIVKVEKDGVVLCHGEEALDNFDYFHRLSGIRITPIFDFNEQGVSDFEIVPRDPDTYKDWQVGDVYVNSNKEEFSVIFRCGEIVFYKRDGYCSSAYTCDELYENNYRLVLTDVEKQILEERNKEEWKPQDGDICYAQTKILPQRFIFIEGHRQYMLVDLRDSGYELDTDRAWKYSYLRLATDEERQQLFDALATKGKRWNADEKRIEDIPNSYEFREYDPVLVRDRDSQEWRLAAFERYDEGGLLPYVCKDNLGWEQCIPYNRDTAKLLNTSNPYTLNR